MEVSCGAATFLRMVSFVTKKGEKDFLSLGVGNRSGVILHGDEYGINLGENPGIIKAQYPAAIFVFTMKDAEPLNRFLLTQPAPPSIKRDLPVEIARICQVVRVKDQGLAFRIKNSSERPLPVPFAIV